MAIAEHADLTISSARLLPVLEQARASNIDINRLFEKLALNPEIVGDSEAVISLADYFRLQNRLSVLIGDETLHLSSRQLLPGSTDFVLSSVAECDSLADVMRMIAKSYNLLHGGTYNAVETRRDSIDYVIDDRAFPYIKDQSFDFICFSIECTLIFLHCILLLITPNAQEAVKGLHFRRATPGGDCRHLGYWAVPIRFGASVYRMSLDSDLAERPIDHDKRVVLTTDAVYQKIIDVVAQRSQHDLQYKVFSRKVRSELLSGVLEQPEIAARLGISVATMRRRLSAEATTFRDLRRTTLNEKARRLLRSQYSVTEVSEILGFAEFRSFNRAFKDWNNETPSAFKSAYEQALETKTP